MKKRILIIIIAVTLTSCQRSCNSFERDFQTSDLNYSIKMYSGGHVVFEDHFKGIVNNSEHSDGVYYYKGDTLIEISGDYVLKAE
jgi:hypothetical protein